jgi:hypothetical protein
MKDTTKWILAAIAVILIIGVGAFALSNGNGTPTVTPTATPEATATPTATPVASATAEPTVTPAPTTTPTATPTVTSTPTPSGKGGIKETEFGYVITYPEFAGSYEIHANPYNVPSVETRAKPLVQFATADGFTNCIYDEEGDGYTMDYGGFTSFEDDGDYGTVYASVLLQRMGNTTGTTNVIITVTRDVCYYDGEEMEYGWGPECYSFTNPVVFTDGQSASDMYLDLCSSESHDNEEYSYYLTFTIQPDDSYDIGTNNAFTIHTWGTGEGYAY